MPQPHLRASDADRAAVADVLGRHMSAGRLTLDEFDERLTRAYAAKTFGELEELTADLPAVDGNRGHERRAAPAPAQAPTPAPTPRNACGPGPWGHGHDIRSAWRAWLTTSLIVVTVWAATSLASWEFHNFWPIWVIGPWGAVLLARTLTGGRQDGPEERRQLRS